MKIPNQTKRRSVKIDVKNPRYEGATFEMVVKAMLQRPKKSDQEQANDSKNSEEPREIKR